MDLVVAKTTAGAVAGGEITWTVTVTNNGPSEASAVTLADPLPAGTTFVAATPAQGTCALDGTTVRCELGALPPQGATQVTIVARTAAEPRRPDAREHGDGHEPGAGGQPAATTATRRRP